MFLGVDVGGTTISVGVVDDKGTLVGDHQVEALGEDHEPGVVVKKIAELLYKALKSANTAIADIAGVGICTPGVLDFDAGIIKCAANLRGWREVPITQLLATELGVKSTIVKLEHDSNAALLAEVWIGAARGKRNVVLLTLGTGVGAGIISDGRLVRGSKGEAGELGHAILIPDGREHGSAGVRGIWEAYMSASSVVARVAEGSMPRNSSLKASSSLTCEDVFKHARDGDAYASSVVSETAKFLAIGCINCARCYDPEVVLFTGGMAKAGEQLLEEVREQYRKYHWNVGPVSMEIRVADAPSHAGVIGAAYAAREAVSSAV